MELFIGTHPSVSNSMFILFLKKHPLPHPNPSNGRSMKESEFKSEKKTKTFILNKPGLSWAKLSPSWGLKLEFEVEV